GAGEDRARALDAAGDGRGAPRPFEPERSDADGAGVRVVVVDPDRRARSGERAGPRRRVERSLDRDPHALEGLRVLEGRVGGEVLPAVGLATQVQAVARQLVAE